MPVDHIVPHVETGFALAQVVHYLLSSQADYLFARLASFLELSQVRAGDVRVEIVLDQFPPRDISTYTSREGPSSECVLSLEARLFVRGNPSVVTFEPRSLASFLTVFKKVSIYLSSKRSLLTLSQRTVM